MQFKNICISITAPLAEKLWSSVLQLSEITASSTLNYYLHVFAYFMRLITTVFNQKLKAYQASLARGGYCAVWESVGLTDSLSSSQEDFAHCCFRVSFDSITPSRVRQMFFIPTGQLNQVTQLKMTEERGLVLIGIRWLGMNPNTW